MRIFIAIDFSEEIRSRITAWIQESRSDLSSSQIKWVKPSQYHVTLKFIGSVRPDAIQSVADRVSEVAKSYSPFSITVVGAGAFPNPKNAQILWVGLDDENGFLRKIAKSLDEELLKLKIPVEKREFHPHLTIARSKDPIRLDEWLSNHKAVIFGACTVSEMTIYESKTLPTGAEYSAIKKFKTALL